MLPDEAVRAAENEYTDADLQPVVTYLANTIAVGEGGFHARSFAPLVPEFRSPPNRGASLWVFTLPD